MTFFFCFLDSLLLSMGAENMVKAPIATYHLHIKGELRSLFPIHYFYNFGCLFEDFT